MLPQVPEPVPLSEIWLSEDAYQELGCTGQADQYHPLLFIIVHFILELLFPRVLLYLIIVPLFLSHSVGCLSSREIWRSDAL